MRLIALVSLVAVLATSVFAFAEIEIVELDTNTSSAAPTSAAPVQANMQLYHQLQTMQEEMMTLRGTIDELQYQLKRLQEQQKNDYIGLDKRISELATVAPVANNASVADDKAAYQAAYDLIPARKFDDAKIAFEVFIQQFEQSSYLPNAYYWLGELYVIDGNDAKAKEAFKVILTRFAEHNKYPEALYKTAIVNYQQGDKLLAKQQLDTLLKQYGDIQANQSVIQKARSFLDKNYP